MGGDDLLVSVDGFFLLPVRLLFVFCFRLLLFALLSLPLEPPFERPLLLLLVLSFAPLAGLFVVVDDLIVGVDDERTMEPLLVVERVLGRLRLLEVSSPLTLTLLDSFPPFDVVDGATRIRLLRLPLGSLLIDSDDEIVEVVGGGDESSNG